MNINDIRKKFTAGKLLKRIIGARTYDTVQNVTEYIIITLEKHNKDIDSLDKRVHKLEQYNKENL